MSDRVTDLQAMALALERLRRAADAVLTCVAFDTSMDKALSELEAAYASSNQDTHTHLHWAQDVLDGHVKHKRRQLKQPSETFDQLRKRAARSNVFVHFVHTFEGTEYAIYRGRVRIASAKTPDRCMSLVRSALRTK